jgi:hypothetical protein
MVESDNVLMSNYAINKLGSVLFQIENIEADRAAEEAKKI